MLGTVLVAAAVEGYGEPLKYNPCLSCNLCVAVCPVGAISQDGSFSFSACYHHNYHEFMGGFGEFAEEIADSGSAAEFRRRVPRPEAVSMWQSLGFGPNYKSGMCVSVCPAGEDVIGPYLADLRAFIQQVLRPLQTTGKTLYALAGSDAEAHAKKRFPKRPRKLVRSTLVPRSIGGFLRGLPFTFQKVGATGLNARYHFTFTGKESAAATIVISEQKLDVLEGHIGTSDVSVTAESDTWLAIVGGDLSVVWAVFRRKLKVTGSLKLLAAFGRCFPE